MPNVNFTVKAKFFIQENSETDKDATFKKLVKQHGELNEFSIDMRPDLKDPMVGGAAFHLNHEKLKSGHFSITHDNDKIYIDCDAVFKMPVKGQYIDDCKSNKMNWFFGGIDGIYGLFDVKQLNEHVHKYYNNRMKKDVEVKYYFIDVKCS